MSMTLEEAIKNREECLRYLKDIGAKATPSCVETEQKKRHLKSWTRFALSMFHMTVNIAP